MSPIIWTYWHQGFDNAPYLVKSCVDRLISLNPDFEVKLLDSKSVYRYVDEIPINAEKWNKMILPHRSDLLRTQLLIKYGGIWTDPTVFVTKPFHNWIHDFLDAGVFFFQNPGKDRLIANWFIAAEQGNYLLERLYSELLNYWNIYDFKNITNETVVSRMFIRIINGRSHHLSKLWFNPIILKILKIRPYMVYHYMFYQLTKKDNHFKLLWHQMPLFEAEKAVLIKRLGFDYKPSSIEFEEIQNTNTPVFKLDWKQDVTNLSNDCLIKLLLKSSSESL